jgi:ribosomal protein S18 acetylase RimI-like enzyme
MGTAARARAEDRFDERRVVTTVVGATRRLLVRAGRLDPRPEAGVRVRPARPEEAAAMASLHRRSMPTAFLPRLGDGFMRQLYLTAIEDPRTVALVAERDGAFAGFATATASVRGFYRRFATRRGALAAAVAAPRLARSSVMRRARETGAYGNGHLDLPAAELLSIAVAEKARGRGVGRALETEIRGGLRERGVSRFKVVVGADNVVANRFYAACGYRAAGETAVHDGVPSRIWVATCPS